MKRIFDKCMAVILKHEGGYQCDPNDLGNWIGEYKKGKLVGTKYGIAARYFPEEDIVNLTEERAKELYWQKYWLPMNLFGIENDLVILHIFDHGVNAGRHRAVKMAQHIAGVTEDGLCGPITRHAINTYCGNFADDFAEARREYYRYIATKRDNQRFLKGWLNRVDSTHF